MTSEGVLKSNLVLLRAHGQGTEAVLRSNGETQSPTSVLAVRNVVVTPQPHDRHWDPGGNEAAKGEGEQSKGGKTKGGRASGGWASGGQASAVRAGGTFNQSNTDADSDDLVGYAGAIPSPQNPYEDSWSAKEESYVLPFPEPLLGDEVPYELLAIQHARNDPGPIANRICNFL